jgi:hypothetical protein
MKRSFIPPSHRPNVRGSKLESADVEQEIKRYLDLKFRSDRLLEIVKRIEDPNARIILSLFPTLRENLRKDLAS